VIFNQNQIQEILNVIDKNTVIYIASTLSVDILSDNDKEILKQAGIKPEQLYTEFTPFMQSFYFGRLSAALGDKRTKELDYKDFLSYLKKGQYVPMTSKEQNMYNIAQNRTYTHLKGLGETMKQTVNGIILEEDQSKRLEYEKIIHDEIAIGIQERKSLRSIVSEIGHKTGDWQRNLGRIVQTEYNNIFQEGRAAQIINLYGADALVYKTVFEKACRFCIKAYLTSGIGSEPRIFKLSELIANGTNIGVKSDSYKPIVTSHHPFCRCQLHHLPKNQVWDKEKKEFRYPENKQPKKRDYYDKITIGDKVFYV
jgi:hypothetical protein